MKTVTIYTDGACSGNPGVGGWGVVLMYNDAKKEISGVNKETTNNRMELFAAISGLNALKESCKVNLYSDSAYLVNAVNEGWLYNWVKNGYKKTPNATEKIKNDDLWKDLYDLMKKHQITFIKVKGHSDNQYNNRCDQLATGQIKNYVNKK